MTTAPLALARVSGLPVDFLRRLQDQDGTAWTHQVIRSEYELAQHSEAASDALHPLIGNNEDQESRRRLINIRRKIYNNKKIGEEDVEFVESVDPAASARIRVWSVSSSDHEQLLSLGAARVGEDVSTSREALRDLVGEPALRAGLEVASPPLAAQLESYVSHRERKEKKRRRFERSVIGYLGRSTVKPSPFSTFTPVQLADFIEDGAPVDDFTLSDHTYSTVRINVAVINRLARLILDDPTRRGRLTVVATSGWARDDDRIRYVRRWVSTGQEQQAVTFDSVTDKMFFLRGSETLEDLLTTLDSGTWSFDQVVQWLAEYHHAPQCDCERYLSALLKVGIVDVPQLQVDVHAFDPWAAFLRELSDLNLEWAARLVEELAPVSEALMAYPDAASAERSDLLAAVRSGLECAFASLDPTGSEAVPQTIVYEDVVAGTAPVHLHRGHSQRQILQPLTEVAPMLQAFDVTLAQRLTFKAFFVSRFGRGGRSEDLLELLHHFHEDFFDQYQTISGQREAFDAEGNYTPEVNWLGEPQLHALDDARSEFTRTMRQAYTDQEDAVEVVLETDLVGRVHKHLRGIPSSGPSSWFVQTARSGRRDLVVLNTAYSGLHFPFSRFAYAFDDNHQVDLAKTLRDRSRANLPDGAVHAEVTGGLITSNLNLHGHLVDYEIVCPGERSSRPPEQQIHLDDLFVEHVVDEDRLALRSRRLGVEVVPTYLGYLIPLALPEIPRAVLLFAQSAMVQLDPWAGLPEAPVDEGVGYRPRVRCGQVVLRRRTWAAAAQDLPVGRPQDDDADVLLRWQRWKHRHGLPSQVFAKVHSDSGFRGAGASKPIFLDFTSVLSLLAFEPLVEDGALVKFTEMLPDLNSAPARGSEGRHAVELAIETLPIHEGASHD